MAKFYIKLNKIFDMQSEVSQRLTHEYYRRHQALGSDKPTMYKNQTFLMFLAFIAHLRIRHGCTASSSTASRSCTEMGAESAGPGTSGSAPMSPGGKWDVLVPHTMEQWRRQRVDGRRPTSVGSRAAVTAVNMFPPHATPPPRHLPLVCPSLCRQIISIYCRINRISSVLCLYVGVQPYRKLITESCLPKYSRFPWIM